MDDYVKTRLPGRLPSSSGFETARVPPRLGVTVHQSGSRRARTMSRDPRCGDRLLRGSQPVRYGTQAGRAAACRNHVPGCASSSLVLLVDVEVAHVRVPGAGFAAATGPLLLGAAGIACLRRRPLSAARLPLDDLGPRLAAPGLALLARFS
jgi:hypothetical protein